MISNPKAMADTRLRPYQQEGAEFVRTHDGAILYWDMGTGKTRAGLLGARKFERIVIVAPKVTEGVWRTECQTIYGFEPTVLAGTKYEDLPDAAVYWMNYEIVFAKWSWFQDHPIDLLILDEAHLVKNKRAGRTQAVHALCGCARKVVALTGTPIYSRPRDLWALLWSVQPGQWPHYYDFVRRYCEGSPTGYGGYRAEGLSRKHLGELQGLLRDVVHRVEWSNVSEVPEMDRVRVPVVLKPQDRTKYDRLIKDVRRVLEGYEGSASPSKAIQLRRISELRMLVGQAKIQPIIDFIATVPPQEKVVVWCYHRDVLFQIQAALVGSGERAAAIVGGMGSKALRREIDFFKGKARFMVASLEAGAVGIDLSMARIAIFGELSWTPAMLVQGERRTWRSTQTRSCLMYYLVAQGTIEDRILDILDEKARLTYDLLDDSLLINILGDVSNRDEDVLQSILDMIKRRTP